MDIQSRQVALTIQTPYYTYGILGEKTESIWIVCHGYGQLARNFVRRFDILDPQKHFVIAPEGLSHLYLDRGYQQIGASWMTRENRKLEIQNQWNYLNNIWEKEFGKTYDIPYKLNLMGFSQGVSTITRWAVAHALTFSRLIMWAGRIPRDISFDKVAFVDKYAEVWAVIGNQDQLITPSMLKEEEAYLRKLFPTQLRIKKFEGGHEVNRHVLSEIIGIDGHMSKQ